MKTIVIIPARMASKRFPNKPLALINGIPKIQRVWENAIKSNIGNTYVACSEKEVFDLITNLGGSAIMTDQKLPSGTDPSTHRNAYRRQSLARRLSSALSAGLRLRPGTTSKGSCGKNRRDSSNRCSELRYVAANGRVNVYMLLLLALALFAGPSRSLFKSRTTESPSLSVTRGFNYDK